MFSQDDLMGSWRLVAFKETSNGVTKDTFGPNPQGQIQYSPEGRMSAMLMHKDYPTTPGDGRFNPDVPFLSYAGDFVVDGKHVIHNVDIASQPFFVGQNLRRVISFDGDQLTLKSEVDNLNGIEIPVQTLVWQRAG